MVKLEVAKHCSEHCITLFANTMIQSYRKTRCRQENVFTVVTVLCVFQKRSATSAVLCDSRLNSARS